MTEDIVLLKSIFVPMNGGPKDELSLETALAMARLFESHLECARVRMTPDYLVWEGGLIDVVGGVIEGDLVAHLDKQDRERTTKALHSFKNFCEREKIPVADAPTGKVGVTARWQELRGHQVAEFVTEARFHDLVVVPRDLLRETDPAADFVGNLLLGCGRPILLAPEQAPETLGKSVVVAWKNTPEAARAVSAAMPVLTQAESVVVLSALEEEAPEEKGVTAHKLAETLQWNGCNASSQPVDPQGHAAAAILDRADALGADLMVMGGYGHSRLRETVLGGFTSEILEAKSAAGLPVPLGLEEVQLYQDAFGVRHEHLRQLDIREIVRLVVDALLGERHLVLLDPLAVEGDVVESAGVVLCEFVAHDEVDHGLVAVIEPRAAEIHLRAEAGLQPDHVLVET